MIYGHGTKTGEEFDLLEMKDVSLVAPPDVLREIAFFLNKMAEEIEAGDFANTHRHIGNTIANWNGRFPDKDIIVCHPGSAELKCDIERSY
jgi:hypothetical protein